MAKASKNKKFRFYREIKSVTVKRKHISLKDESDQYGHWWIELDGVESYGWWPERPVSSQTPLRKSLDVFRGIVGELNGTYYGGNHLQDAHHGESADEEFHPLVDASDLRSDSDIMDCLRKFAKAYNGKWSWPVGKNCHSFQKAALRHCKLQCP